MKYVIVIPDGCADEPQAFLEGRTPLQAAVTPQMDEIARVGCVGRACNVPMHLPAGSAVANMSLLGYDPNQFFTGRAPLEAAAQGIELGPDDWAIRCNLVTVQDATMHNFTADHISSEEARELLAVMQAACGSDQIEFVPGVSYRNLVIFRGAANPPFSRDTVATPPHDLTDKSVLDDYPRGPGSDVLEAWMRASIELFVDHPVNQRRVAEGKLPATCIWLWGVGGVPRLTNFERQHEVQGAMITAVDLLRGLATLIGWDRIEVPGATGYTDTDYAAKGRYAVDALDRYDLVCVHVEATDEASHEGDLGAKMDALAAIDDQIVRVVHQALREHGEYRILITPDHPTPVRTKTHSHGMVPFAMAGAGIAADALQTYDEQAAGISTLVFQEGHQLMPHFLG